MLLVQTVNQNEKFYVINNLLNITSTDCVKKGLSNYQTTNIPHKLKKEKLYRYLKKSNLIVRTYALVLIQVFLPKIVEIVINKRISSYFKSNKLFYKNEYSAALVLTKLRQKQYYNLIR